MDVEKPRARQHVVQEFPYVQLIEDEGLRMRWAVKVGNKIPTQ